MATLNLNSHQESPEYSPGSPNSRYLSDITTPASDDLISTTHPIAICGLAMRLPGKIRNAEAFWDLLENGRDARGPIPPDRYSVDGFGDSLGGKGAIVTRHGYFLEEDLSSLDTSFFTMTKSELERTDPQQRQLLEVTRECLESAGEVNYRGKLVGCYVGTFGEDWLQMSAKESQHSGGYVMTGHGDLMIANRVSYEYDFKGPSMVVKTGCSASLVALHEACRALQFGDCTSAIVAGTNLILGPTTTAAMTQEGILSPDASCKTFDEKADGFARAEAITAVYIKRLDDAIRDGNPIRSIIRGTGINSDGKSQSLMSPNGKSHEALMRKVYHDAGLDPQDTAFVECHGTGTPTGDPIETIAVGNVFGKKGVYIGSVKPNVGHSEGSSGITSLIKAVLALEHKIFPPNIKFANPNPQIPFKEKRLVVPILPTAFPDDRAERISINSFGIGGANAHVILDAYSPPTSPGINGVQDNSTSLAQLLLFSANTNISLRQHIDQIHDFVRLHPESLNDVSYTLGLRRENLPHRAFAIVKDRKLIQNSLLKKIPGNIPEIALVFSGQGAQWPEMGRQLIEADSNFRADIDSMDKTLQGLKHPPSWTLIDELQKPEATSQINRAELSQPLCTAIQIALVNKFFEYGLVAKAVVGHSSGEIAAAYAAGSLSKEEAIIVAYYRGYVTKKQNLIGGMAAVGLDKESTSKFLQGDVVIACENSSSSTTISGDLNKVEKVIASIKAEKPDVLARLLKVDIAYHSRHMVHLGHEYRHLVDLALIEIKTTRRDPHVPFFSSVSGKLITNSDEFGSRYWESNLTSPVLFNTAVNKLLHERGETLLLEIGPHSTLAGPLRQICSSADRACSYVSAMIRGKDCVESLLSAVGQLCQEGIQLDLSPLYPYGKIVPGLPTYPWDHNASYWYESRVAKDWRFRKFGHHCLLGLRVPESPSTEPTWRNVLNLEDEPWLADHKVRHDVVFPFAGYVAMAGEAVRQLTGVEVGYGLRHIVAHTALVLTESKSAEIVTTLRRYRLNDFEDADSFEFTISSYNGSTWLKNCEGRVKPLRSNQLASPEPVKLARNVDTSQWYEAMARIGIVYGPEFQSLTNITSSAAENLAAAEIVDPSSHQQAPFLCHPASIDACLQLLLVAFSKGLGRNFNRLHIPTLVEELEIYRSAKSMDARAWSLDSRRGVGVECIADGKTALRLTGIQLTSLDEDRGIVESDIHAAARLEWLPDFDFLNIAPLFTPPKSDKMETRLQEEMSLLCILDSAKKLEGLTPKQPHFMKFQDWLLREIRRAESGTYTLVEDSREYAKLSRSARNDMINDRFSKLLTMPKRHVAIGLKRIRDNIEAIFTGSADTLDILMQDDVLTQIYNVVSFGHSDFVHLLSNTKPNLRILEVGAGTGGTTELILRDLVDKGGLPAYSIYTFTDVSAGFFPQAKERFAYAYNLDYKVFDISQDPFQQGLQAASYDVILAPNVVHATPCIQDTLRNLQPLLKPDGYLVLTELCAVVRAPNYIFGNFSGWWLGEADNRKYEPYIPVSRWDSELKAAGFTGVETSVYDEEEPYQYCAAILSKPKASSRPDVTAVTVLCDKPDESLARSLIDYLNLSGLKVSVCGLKDQLPEYQDIISVLDIENNFFENIPESSFVAFQEFLRRHKSQKILWLTKPSQIQCKNPRSAQTIGVARTIRSELAIPFYTLEINEDEKGFSNLVTKVFHKISSVEDSDNLATDKEFVVDSGVIKIGRYHPFSLQDETCEMSLADSIRNKTLEIGKPGILETLQWREEALQQSLQNTEVEIETRAIGLNFRDIIYAMGIISSDTSKVPLGLETSGIVHRVGPDVLELAPGDRVIALAPHGCIATKAVLPASLCVKIPNDLSHEEAATMPICFATAIRALIDVGRLEKGQSALIHSACGGVGLASLQICRLIGVEVFTTVSSDKKVQHLIDNFNIPRNHIFNSRDASFVSDLMRETESRGVDLVLNSLSGELLHSSWECVAEYGTMIELGKRDLAGFGHLEMQPFLANRSYSCLDISQFIREKPAKMGEMLKTFLNLRQRGEIQPLSPVTFFDASEAEKSFRYLQKGDHIGKVVIRVPQDTSIICAKSSPRHLTFDPEASYLLVGGLGGLGKSIATWLVERGARYLTFLSRNAGLKNESRTFFSELESLGCSISPIAGSVDKQEDVKKAISESKRPIKGVFQLAMVLQDAPIIDMTYSAWNAACAPKVDGTWNLHNAFLEHTLDFFWLASSLVTVVDQPGQGNYNAANTFLEAFCQHRHNLGLPASTLNICPINGVGFVAENPIARKNMKAQGLYFLGEGEFLDFLELSIINGHPPPTATKAFKTTTPTAWKNHGQILMGLRSELHLDDPNNRTNWRRDRRMGIYHNIHTESSNDASAEASAVKTFLAQVAEDMAILDQKASFELLAYEIGRKIFDFMLKPDEEVDISISLTEAGLDSLMAIELRRWFRQALGLQISVLEIMGSGSLIELGKATAAGLKVKIGS